MGKEVLREDHSGGKHIDSDFEEELCDLKVLNIASTQQRKGDAQLNITQQSTIFMQKV